MHVCPVAAKIPATTPLVAASRSASANTMLGDLPPSSSETLARWSAASFITLVPVSVEPVNATLSTPSWRTSARPVSAPPVTTLNTPGGNPASSISRANSSVDAGVCSAGLTTTVQPAASAVASLKVSSSSGEFHGTTIATTPIGSRRV